MRKITVAHIRGKDDKEGDVGAGKARQGIQLGFPNERDQFARDLMPGNGFYHKSLTTKREI